MIVSYMSEENVIIFTNGENCYYWKKKVFLAGKSEIEHLISKFGKQIQETL